MAKTKDFRTQTSAVSTPGAGVVSYYVDSSGILKFVHNNGTDYFATTFYADTLGPNGITNTGFGVFRKVSAECTGLVYGRTGTYTVPSILGEPDLWVKVLGPSGQLMAIPAFYRTI